MRHATNDLGLDELTVIHAGEHGFPMAEKTIAVPLPRMLQSIGPTRFLLIPRPNNLSDPCHTQFRLTGFPVRA